MIARAVRRGRARATSGLRDVHTSLWLGRRLWRPLVAELPGLRGRRRPRARTPSRLVAVRRLTRRA
jgi:hypothetical protein